MAEPGTKGFKEFAESQGWAPSYVTQLKKSGRLVLTPDGRRVIVAESLQRIADTRSPDKVGVAARHAASRPAGEPDPAPEEADAPAAPLSPPGDDPISIRRATAQMEVEEAKARRARREEALELGQLLEVDAVRAVVADAITKLRTALENLPATLAARLAAEPDEATVRVLLLDAIENELGKASRQMAKLAKVEG